MIDYSVYPKNNRIYTGSEEKFGITIDDEYFIVKFQKNSENGLLNNHISEHLGSMIFSLAGENVQWTRLGLYQQRPIVLCKDFNNTGSIFTPFNGVGESSLDRDKEMYQYDYQDIVRMLQDNIKITQVSTVIEKFWNMFIIDALIGNFDRHGANWGFIKKDNQYTMAPIFVNGSSLFPRRNTEQLMLEAMNDSTVLHHMTFKYPASQIKINHKKSSYYEVINSLQFEACNEALTRMYPKINLDQICSFIDGEEMLTSIQKKFYKFIIQHRYKHIIKASYERLVNQYE